MKKKFELRPLMDTDSIEPLYIVDENEKTFIVLTPYAHYHCTPEEIAKGELIVAALNQYQDDILLDTIRLLQEYEDKEEARHAFDEIKEAYRRRTMAKNILTGFVRSAK